MHPRGQPDTLTVNPEPHLIILSVPSNKPLNPGGADEISSYSQTVLTLPLKLICRFWPGSIHRMGTTPAAMQQPRQSAGDGAPCWRVLVTTSTTRVGVQEPTIGDLGRGCCFPVVYCCSAHCFCDIYARKDARRNQNCRVTHSHPE